MKNINSIIHLEKWEPNVEDIIKVYRYMKNKRNKTIEIFKEEAETSYIEMLIDIFKTAHSMESIKNICQSYFIVELKIILESIAYKEFRKRAPKENAELIEKILGIDSFSE